MVLRTLSTSTRAKHAQRLLRRALSAMVSSGLVLLLLSGQAGAQSAPSPQLQPQPCGAQASLRSVESVTPTSILFVNNSDQPVSTFWINFSGQLVFFSSLAPHTQVLQPTFLTHPWVVVDDSGGCVAIFLPIADPAVAAISATTQTTTGVPLNPLPCNQEPLLHSVEGVAPTSILFVNRGNQPISTYWLDYNGARVLYSTIAAHASVLQLTYLTHPWVVTDGAQRCLAIFQPVAQAGVAAVGDGTPPKTIVELVATGPTPADTLLNQTPTPDAPYVSGTWVNRDVRAKLVATDDASGIQSVTFNWSLEADGLPLHGSPIGGATIACGGVPQCTVPIDAGSSTGAFANNGILTLTFFSTDGAGNQETPPPPAIIKIDKTPPQVATASRTPPPTNGWNNTPVVVVFGCVLDFFPEHTISPNCPVTATLSKEGAGQSAAVTFTDQAGNTNTALERNINIDLTPPVVTLSTDAQTYTVDQTVGIACRATDALSGVASSTLELVGATTPPAALAATCVSGQVPAYQFAVGSNTLRATAKDLAGNQTTAPATFSVLVTPASLGQLTQQFVVASGRPGAAGVATALRTSAQLISAAPTPQAKALAVTVYGRELQAAVSGRFLTQAQADTLLQLAKKL